MDPALTTYVLLAPGLPPGQQLPPRPASPSWGALAPEQRAQLLDATPLVLEVIPGRTTLLALDSGATADRVEEVDLRNLDRARQPGAWDRALDLAGRLVTRQISKGEDQHDGHLTAAERQEAWRELVEPAAWSILLRFDPEKAPTPSAWLLSPRGPMNNAIRKAVRASSRRQRAAKESSPPPARRGRAKAIDIDPLVLACRAGMLAHLGVDPLALAFLHQGLAPNDLASSPAMQRSTRRRLAVLRQQAKGWARTAGYTAADASRAFPARCPGFSDPAGAVTVEALRALELHHRDAAWSERG